MASPATLNQSSLVVRASDSGSGDPGSILTRVGVLCPWARNIYSPKVLVIPRNRWPRLNMTEKLFTRDVKQQSKKKKKKKKKKESIKTTDFSLMFAFVYLFWHFAVYKHENKLECPVLDHKIIRIETDIRLWWGNPLIFLVELVGTKVTVWI